MLSVDRSLYGWNGVCAAAVMGFALALPFGVRRGETIFRIIFQLLQTHGGEPWGPDYTTSPGLGMMIGR